MSDSIQFNCTYTELKDPKLLLPSPKNPNKHSDAQIERLILLIKYYGFRHPIIVSKQSGFIVAGHGRWQCAIKAGFEQVPVDYQDFESVDQEYAFMIADNAVAEWSELDLSMVNAEMVNLGPDFDVALFAIEKFTVDVADGEMPEIEDKEKEDIGQMAFLVTEDQRERIQRAIDSVLGNIKVPEDENKNRNANALTFICDTYVTDYGNNS